MSPFPSAIPTLVRPDQLVLTFHGIGEATRVLDAGEDRVWLSRDRFLRLLDAVVDDRRVEITFDDGNRSDVDGALPALLDRGLHATFFVCSGRLGSSGFLSDTDLRELVEKGMEIGSHGMTHRSWRALDAATAQAEIVDAKAVLARSIGRPIVKAACPFGAYDRGALKRLKRAGFETVYTSDGGLSRPGQWLKARNTVGPQDEPSVVGTWLASHAKRSRRWMTGAKRIVKRFR